MSEQPLRIATFNIHHAEGKDKVVDIRRTAEVIGSLEVDLIALQELDVGLRRSRNVDQPAELADLLGMYIYFAPALELDGGEYGIALASSDAFKGSVRRLSRIGDEEPRVAIVASWRSIGIVATHLSRDAAARAIQTVEVAQLASQLGTPSIVLGDLNQARRYLSPLAQSGLTPVKPKRRGRSFRLGADLDHILVSGGLTVASATSTPTTISDHPVLVAELMRGK